MRTLRKKSEKHEDRAGGREEGRDEKLSAISEISRCQPLACPIFIHCYQMQDTSSSFQIFLHVAHRILQAKKLQDSLKNPKKPAVKVTQDLCSQITNASDETETGDVVEVAILQRHVFSVQGTIPKSCTLIS